MSPQKSTIGRSSSPGSAVVDPARNLTPQVDRPVTPAATNNSSRPGADPSSPTSSASRAQDLVGLRAPRGSRQLFGALERLSPGLGGTVAERLWFRLPPAPKASRREQRMPPGGESFTVDWGDGVVRGRVHGHWGNPTAYLVHGWGGWWQQLAAFVEPMVAAGLCVVAFDLPGHGGSGPGRLGRRASHVVEMAEALAAVVAEFGRPTLVVAHSLGAMATVQALPLGVRPVAYGFLAPPRSAEPMVATFAASLGIGPRSQAVLRRRIERRAGIGLPDLDVLTAASRQPDLPRLLLVHDRTDRETPVQGSVEIKDAWHDARLLLTDGLGHRRLLWDPVVVERVTDLAVAAAAEVRRSSR